MFRSSNVHKNWNGFNYYGIKKDFALELPPSPPPKKNKLFYSHASQFRISIKVEKRIWNTIKKDILLFNSWNFLSKFTKILASII